MDDHLEDRAPPEIPEILYHYTSQSGLIGMLKSRSIWASKIHYLNDSREFALALDLARDELKQRRKHAALSEGERERLELLSDSIDTIQRVNICVCSFSAVRDSILATNADAEPDYWDRNRGYTDPERPRTFIVLRHAGDDFAHRLAEIAPRIKHESFKDEKEWRLVSRAISVWDLEHRSGESMIIPYYSIPIDYEGQLEPISEIVVGPTPHTELSKESVHSLALASGMIKTDGSGITISTTRIPFRNW